MDIIQASQTVTIPGREAMPLVPSLRRPVRTVEPRLAPYVAPRPAQPPAASQPVRVSRAAPVFPVKPRKPPEAPAILYTPPRPAPPVEPRWRVLFAQPLVEMAAMAAPVPSVAPAPFYAVSNFASSVALVPTGGTYVTSTPANLLIGPVTYIADFTIHALDAGTYP